MATPSPRDILKGVTGRLCHSPTNLALPYPHGGVALGVVRDVKVRLLARTKAVRAEEWGGARTTFHALEAGVVLGCVLRSWDDDALAAVFPDGQAGDATGRRVVRAGALTDGLRAGAILPAVKLLLSPDDSNDPGVIVYRAVPLPEENAELRFLLSEEIGIPVLWHGTPDPAGRLWASGLLEDLEL